MCVSTKNFRFEKANSSSAVRSSVTRLQRSRIMAKQETVRPTYNPTQAELNGAISVVLKQEVRNRDVMSRFGRKILSCVGFYVRSGTDIISHSCSCRAHRSLSRHHPTRPPSKFSPLCKSNIRHGSFRSAVSRNLSRSRSRRTRRKQKETL